MQSALRRELREELGVQVAAARPLLEFSHEYSERHVQLSVWLVERFSGAPAGREGQQLQWVTPAALRSLPLLQADLPIVEWLERHWQLKVQRTWPRNPACPKSRWTAMRSIAKTSTPIARPARSGG